MGFAKLLACVDPAVLPTQPLPICQPCARQVHRHPRSSETVDRLAVELLGCLTWLHERTRARQGTDRPLRSAGTGALGEAIDRATCDFQPTTPRSRLHQLVQRPR